MDTAIEEGPEEGKLIGIYFGKKAGNIEGKKAMNLEIIRKGLSNNMSVVTYTQLTGLTENEILNINFILENDIA